MPRHRALQAASAALPRPHAPPRAPLLSAGLAFALFLALALFLAGAAPAAAQQTVPAPWQPGGEAPRRLDPSRPPAPAATPPAPAAATGNTPTQPPGQPSAQPSGQPAAQPRASLALSAALTQDGDAIDQGVVWRVYSEVPGTEPPQLRLVTTSRQPTPTLPLPPGSYLVNVGFGRAHLTRRITLAEGKPQEERFILNAGGLRVTAVLGQSEKVPDLAVSYDIYQGDADQLGGRAKVVGGLRPGVIVRLNAGLYHLVSTMGDANAMVSTDVTVEAGKLTDAVIGHHAARVTLKLVARAGGEAQADTQWSIHSGQGELVRESQGALPTHILAAGDYVATARHAGRLYQRPFAVRPGEPLQVEVVMQ